MGRKRPQVKPAAVQLARESAAGGLPEVRAFLEGTERGHGASGLGYALGIAEGLGASALIFSKKTAP